MTKAKVFLFLAASFIAGIFVRSFWEADFLSVEYALLLGSVILLAVFYRNRKIALVSFSIISLVLGIWRTDGAIRRMKAAALDGKDFSGIIRVAKEPQMKNNYSQITGEIIPGGTRVIFNTGLYSDIEYGDELDVACVLKVPENKDESFDYRMYLAKDGVRYECFNPQIEKTGRNSGNPIYHAILKLKNKLSGNIDRVIPQPEGALAGGLIFGGSAALPKAVSDNFSRTGMTHIVAVSGYNVTIIAEYLILFGIFIGLWRKQAFWFAVAGIFLFVLMVGFPSSAVRAGVMGSLLLWAMKNGRLANSTNAILLAASVMLLLNPLLLRYDIGFQLSFLATMGIVWLAPLFERYASKNYNWLDWQGIILLTISAQIFVTPIIIFNFHKLSLISLLANLLILPIIPLSMLLVFLTALAGSFSYYFSLPFAWVAFLPLKYEVWIVNVLGNLKWSSLETGDFHWGWVVGWYGVLFSAIFLIKRNKTMKLEADAE